jgi:hypothetical protein
MSIHHWETDVCVTADILMSIATHVLTNGNLLYNCLIFKHHVHVSSMRETQHKPGCSVSHVRACVSVSMMSVSASVSV